MTVGVTGRMEWLLGDPIARRVVPPGGWSAGVLGLLAAVLAFFAVLALALAAPSTAVTLVTYGLHGHVDWVLAAPLALGGLLSISWGVRLAHALPERTLRMLFAGFLLLCALLLGLRI